ncbi:hypothetical protein [Phenylobacterium sp.]|jgi:hypothetical protein|uniref:hypothetical protein n=1 Tax=Phenylobacterium sp. TaxID=1871053 RepID=UPI002F93C561
MKTFQRRLTLLFPAAAAAFALAGFAHADEAAEAMPSPQGTVGVCVRWGADANKLADVVVVEPSGDQTLDTAIPGTLLGMPWKRPQGYGGEWVGLSVGVAGSQPKGKVPDCASLAAEDVTGPARPLAIGKLLKA